MKSVCQPVTALFDINRESIDGRSIDQYLNWLSKTLELFPTTIVFHDGSCDNFVFDKGIFVKIEKNSLWIFKLSKKISEILKEFDPVAKADITFLNPLYSMVQFSKFELLVLAKNLSPAESYLWIDAGISRFLKEGSHSSILNNNVEKLLRRGYRFTFEIDLKNNLNFFKLKIRKSEVGTSRRVISGTSFWIKEDSVITIWEMIQMNLVIWLNENKWDNEQVMLRKIVEDLESVNFIVQWNAWTGSVARKFLKKRIRISKFRNVIIEMLL